MNDGGSVGEDGVATAADMLVWVVGCGFGCGVMESDEAQQRLGLGGGMDG